MARGKEKSSHSWEQRDGYKPEWAQEIDTEGAAKRRSASERFDRAIEMGVKASQTLERDKTLGLIPSSGRSRRRFVAVLAAVLLLVGAVTVSLGTHHSNAPTSVSQQKQDVPAAENNAPVVQDEDETTFIQAKEQPDGSYRAHLTLTHGTQGLRDTQQVAVPEKIVLDTSQPWIMRVKGSVDESSQYGRSCKPLLSYNSESGGKSTVSYSDACRNMQQSAVEELYALPAPFPTVKDKESDYKVITPGVAFTGGGVHLDVDFLPVSAIAVSWGTNEPLKGNMSTFIAFSGSLEDLKLNFGYCRVALYIYKPSEGFRYLNDPHAVSIMPEHYSGMLKQDLIKELGFDRDDASGYLFIEIMEKGSRPPWWQLN